MVSPPTKEVADTIVTHFGAFTKVPAAPSVATSDTYTGGTITTIGTSSYLSQDGLSWIVVYVLPERDVLAAASTQLLQTAAGKRGARQREVQ